MTPRIGARIAGTGAALPSRSVDTEELLRIALPHRDSIQRAELERRIGIRARYWLGEGETAAGLGARALALALEAARLDASSLKRLIFVSSTGGDQLIPSTANSVAAELGIDDTCDAFDVNNSCAGFVSALDVAARSVATGLWPVAVVTSETFSRYVGPTRPRPYLVLGDAAAAVILDRADGAAPALLASHLRNSSALRGRMTTRHPGVTRTVELIDFEPSSEELTAAALDAIQRSARTVLSEAELGVDDVAWWLPHQPNGEMLGSIVASLGIDPARLSPIVSDIGSVGAASIPYSLDRVARAGKLRAGDRILMAGVGSGTGYGALLWQVGA